MTKRSGGIGSWSVTPSPFAGITPVIPVLTRWKGCLRRQSQTFSRRQAFLLMWWEVEKNQREQKSAAADVLANGAASGTQMAGVLDHAAAVLERVVAIAPTACYAIPAPVA